MANILVNSLKRLYATGKITEGQVRERVAKGIITKDDYKTITGKQYEESTS